MASTIINAIPEYLITAVVSTAIFYLMNAGKNLLHSKVQHAKTTQSKELWSFIEQVANMAVNSLVSKNITGDAKFAQATAIVQDALAKQGFTNVDVKAIESAVQSAYEKADLKTKKPIIKSVVKATPQEITTSIAPTGDMPGASKKAETKPYSPETAKSIKGIPTGNLEDIAVQTPKKEEGTDNGN